MTGLSLDMEIDTLDAPVDMGVDEGVNSILQTAATLEPDPTSGLLWRLPIEPTGKKVRGVGAMKQSADTVAAYNKRCGLIAKHWQTKDAQEWIPAELRQSTPYSLALLDGLRTLASGSKHQRDSVHDKLLTVRNTRLRDCGSLESCWVTTPRPDADNCEKEVCERVDGIMLADISAIYASVKEDTARARPPKPPKVRSNRPKDSANLHLEDIQAEQARAVERVVSRRRKKHLAQADLQRELWVDPSGNLALVGVELGGGDEEGNGLTPSRRSRRMKSKMVHARLDEMTFLGNGKRQRNQPRAKNSSTALPLRPARTSPIPASVARRAESDSDSEWDSGSDGGVPLPSSTSLHNPDALEPARLKKGEANMFSEVKNLIGIMNVSSPARPPPRQPFQRGRCVRGSTRREEKLRRRVAEKSVRLPSEKMDFGALGPLEDGADREAMMDVMGALGALGVENESRAAAWEGKENDEGNVSVGH